MEHWTGDSEFTKGTSKNIGKIDEIIKTYDQGEKVQKHYLALLVCARVWDDLPRV